MTTTTAPNAAPPATGWGTGTPDPIDIHVGHRLRELRTARGLSLAPVGFSPDISQNVGASGLWIGKISSATKD